jgi:hypothetical protein
MQGYAGELRAGQINAFAAARFHVMAYNFDVAMRPF